MKDVQELRFYSTEQACEMLNLGRTYLYYCRLAGVLEATKVGRRVLYTDKQLAAFRQRLIDDAPRVHRLIQQLLRRSKKRR
jgi:excisionase family DNA binding protein